MKSMLASATVALGLILSTPGNAQRFSNPTLGLSIEKPQHWQILTAAANADKLKKAEIGNAEFQAAVQRYAATPLYAFMKHPEPFPGLNPSVKINTRPTGSLADESGQEILEVIVPGLSRAMADFKVITAPESIMISGRSSGHTRISYTLKVDGKAYPAISEMWIIPRGDHIVIIGAGYPQNADAASRTEVLGIVHSLQISDAHPLD